MFTGLVVKTTFITEHHGEEVHEDAVLLRELGAETADRLDNDDLELVADLLYKAVHGGLGTGLEKGGDGPVCVQVAGGHGGKPTIYIFFKSFKNFLNLRWCS